MKAWMTAVMIVGVLILVLPAYNAGSTDDDAPQRVIVTFKQGTDHKSILKNDDVLLELGIINGAAIMATPGRIKALQNTDGVVSVSEDKVAEMTVDTPYKRLSWGVNRIDADMVWNHVDSSSISDGATGEGIDVAVLDTGIDLDHPDLVGNIGIGYDFVNGDSFADDDNGHGTHCAGIIAGNEATTDNGMIGVAPGATLHPVKVLNRRGSGYYSWIISGINWCINNGIDVISMSLSGPADSNLKTAIDNAKGKAIIVAAAGNSGDSDYQFDDAFEYPAAYDSVISVAAIDRNDKIASFSTLNSAVDIAAPGVSIYSTYKGGGYATMSGTSMACPHVAGVVALMLEKGISIPISIPFKTDVTPSDNDINHAVSLIDALQSCGFADTFAPMISEVKTTVTTTSATITFYTDEPADATVAITGTDTSKSDTGLLTHSLTLSGLTTSTLYAYTITATDGTKSGGADTSAFTLSFTTASSTTTRPGKPPKK